MNIITGYRETPHITSAQDRAKNQGAFGTGSYILNVGDKLAADIVSANEIRIRDGVLCMQGCVANIEEGAYDSCEISNGTQGMQRRDLIVARYTKDAETNIEDIQLVVIEGTPASSSPSDPSYNSGDIQAGDSPVDFPLYRVNISGVNVSSTTRLASYVRTQAETDTLLGNTSISGIGGGTITGAISALNGKLIQFGYFEVTVPGNNYAEYTLQFPVGFPSVPSLILTPVIWSDPKLQSVCILTRFQNSGRIRVSNNGASQITAGVNWIAIGDR